MRPKIAQLVYLSHCKEYNMPLHATSNGYKNPVVSFNALQRTPPTDNGNIKFKRHLHRVVNTMLSASDSKRSPSGLVCIRITIYPALITIGYF